MSMVVDRRATSAAQKAHAAGVKHLDLLFDVTPEKIASAGIQHGGAKPVRLHPNTPPVRDAEHQAKHLKRKAARAARRRNRR